MSRLSYALDLTVIRLKRLSGRLCVGLILIIVMILGGVPLTNQLVVGVWTFGDDASAPVGAFNGTGGVILTAWFYGILAITSVIGKLPRNPINRLFRAVEIRAAHSFQWIADVLGVILAVIGGCLVRLIILGIAAFILFGIIGILWFGMQQLF